MAKKSIYEKRDIVLGFDETNNGLNLDSKNPHHKTSMIITGYLGNSLKKNKNYEGSRYEHKGFAFSRKEDTKEILRRGKIFLYDNSHFFYTSLSKEDYSPEKAVDLRADPIILLTLKFILSYGLEPSNTQLIIYQIEGIERSKKIGKSIEKKFKKLKLNIPFRFIKGAELNKIPVRKADRAGYWISALHFLGKNHKWSYKHRRVSMTSLEKLAIEFLDMQEKDYPEP